MEKKSTTTHKPKSVEEPSQKIYKTRVQLAVDNFIGGISWGVGSVIGATLVVAIIGLILAQTRRLPLIGAIVENVMTEIEHQQQSKQE